MNNKTLYYIRSKEYKEICWKCFDKEETKKYWNEERLDSKYYEIGTVEVNLDEYFKLRTNDIPKYLNKLIKGKKND